MQVRALRTFNSKNFGLIRDGMIVTVDDRYGNQIIKSGLAERHVPDAGDPLQPQNDKSLPGPDKTKDDDAGNGERDDDTNDSSRTNETSSEHAPESGETESSSAGRRGGGRKKRSSSRRQAPR